VASGKSSVSSMLKKEGLNIINADSLVHQIYKKKESLEFIKNNFPAAIKDGVIDFKVLRKIFFEDKKKKKQIENFIYSKLEEEFLKESKNIKNVIIYDVPLLFEKGLDKFVDVSICVYCPENLQIKRLMERDNIDETLAKNIISSQMNIEKKRKLSNFIIRNDKTLEKTLEEVKKMKELFFN
jgi:dephospho-CoA kinase